MKVDIELKTNNTAEYRQWLDSLFVEGKRIFDYDSIRRWSQSLPRLEGTSPLIAERIWRSQSISYWRVS